MSEQPIKSPFLGKRVVRHTSTDEIVETMVDCFAKTLEIIDDMDHKANESTLTAYLSGFTSSLKALGFEEKDAMKLTKQVGVRIIEIGTSDEPCDCPNCKGKES